MLYLVLVKHVETAGEQALHPLQDEEGDPSHLCLRPSQCPEPGHAGRRKGTQAMCCACFLVAEQSHRKKTCTPKPPPDGERKEYEQLLMR